MGRLYSIRFLLGAAAVCAALAVIGFAASEWNTKKAQPFFPAFQFDKSDPHHWRNVLPVQVGHGAKPEGMTP